MAITKITTAPQPIEEVQKINEIIDAVNARENIGVRNIGEIVQSTIPLTDAGLHLLDGSLISGSGSYADFVTYIAGLVSTYPSLFETEANWQSAVATYDVCGKFVYDSTNNTVRLPKITGIIEGTTDLTALGDLVEAGLPNITGNASSNYNTGFLNQTVNGAFGKSSITETSYLTGVSGNSNRLDFDASRSSSIYGNSTTVQPQTIKVLYYICIATSTKTDIEVDIDQITADLNGKADKDLSNITNIPQIFKTVAVNSMGIDTSTAISRSLNTNYTATRDCWVFHDQNANNNSVFYVDGVAVSDNYWHPERTSAKGSALVFITTGQVWQASGGNSVVEFGILGDL